MGLFGKLFGKKDTRRVTIPLPCIHVRFDVDKCDDKFAYGSDCCNRLLDAISPKYLDNTIAFTGDSEATLAGAENVFIIAIASRDKEQLKRIEYLAKQSEDLIAHCSYRDPVQVLDCSREPLMLSGNIVDGVLENCQDYQLRDALKKHKV